MDEPEHILSMYLLCHLHKRNMLLLNACCLFSPYVCVVFAEINCNFSSLKFALEHFKLWVPNECLEDFQNCKKKKNSAFFHLILLKASNVSFPLTLRVLMERKSNRICTLKKENFLRNSEIPTQNSADSALHQGKKTTNKYSQYQRKEKQEQR